MDEDNLLSKISNNVLTNLENSKQCKINTFILTCLLSSIWIKFVILDSNYDIISIIFLILITIFICFYISGLIIYYTKSKVYFIYLIPLSFLIYNLPISLQPYDLSYVNLFHKEIISKYELIYNNSNILEEEFNNDIDNIEIKALTSFSNKNNAIIYFTDNIETIKCSINKKGFIIYCWN